jgi:hypothetical protein
MPSTFEGFFRKTNLFSVECFIIWNSRKKCFAQTKCTVVQAFL